MPDTDKCLCVEIHGLTILIDEFSCDGEDIYPRVYVPIKRRWQRVIVCLCEYFSGCDFVRSERRPGYKYGCLKDKSLLNVTAEELKQQMLETFQGT